MDIGKKIKDLRRQKNLTQEELGERTDLSKGYISQLERNLCSPSMETFFNILEVLGSKPKDFFSEQQYEQRIHYPKSEQTIYDEYDDGYMINWLVPDSNEFDMEPVINNGTCNGDTLTLSTTHILNITVFKIYKFYEL